MRLTTSPPSCAERHEIWEHKTPGTLWGHTGPVTVLFYLTFTYSIFASHIIPSFYHISLSLFHIPHSVPCTVTVTCIHLYLFLYSLPNGHVYEWHVSEQSAVCLIVCR